MAFKNIMNDEMAGYQKQLKKMRDRDRTAIAKAKPKPKQP
jgi:hypothetical protein